MVSGDIYHRLSDLYEFVALAAKVENGNDLLQSWQLKSTVKPK